MNGHIITESSLGWRWIYVPEAQIKFHAVINGANEMVVIAYRTDSFVKDGNKKVLDADFIRQTCTFDREVEVPDDLVEFALSAAEQQQIGLAAVENSFKKLLGGEISDRTVLETLEEVAEISMSEEVAGMRMWEILPNPTNRETGDD